MKRFTALTLTTAVAGLAAAAPGASAATASTTAGICNTAIWKVYAAPLATTPDRAEVTYRDDSCTPYARVAGDSAGSVTPDARVTANGTRTSWTERYELEGVSVFGSNVVAVGTWQNSTWKATALLESVGPDVGYSLSAEIQYECKTCGGTPARTVTRVHQGTFAGHCGTGCMAYQTAWVQADRSSRL